MDLDIMYEQKLDALYITYVITVIFLFMLLQVTKWKDSACVLVYVFDIIL